MKKIAFLINDWRNYFSSLTKEAQDQKIILDVVKYSEIAIHISAKRNSILFKNNPINKYDLIYFRNIKQQFEIQTLISSIAKQQNIKVLDPCFNSNRTKSINKSNVHFKLIQNNIPTIDSVLASLDQLPVIQNKLLFPCIAKITDGAQGKGVYFCKTLQNLKQVFDKVKTKLLIQRFIPNDGDYRLFVVGDKVIGSMKQVVKKGEFRNNYSLGGEIFPHQATNSQIKLALDATSCLGLSIAGVDLINDREKWKIIEVNKSPQFIGLTKASNINVPRHIISFFKSQL